MKRLTRELIKNAAASFETGDVKVPAWNVVVEVRPLSGKEVRDINKLMDAGEFNEDPIGHMAQMIADCAAPFESVDEVLDLDFRGVKQLGEAIMRFSGMSVSASGVDPEDLDDEVREFLEEVEGNSETTPS